MLKYQEKIAFLYPTLVQEGASFPRLHAPSFILNQIDFSKTYSFYLTAGLIFFDEKNYTASADVFYDGKSVLNVDKSEEPIMEVHEWSISIPNQLTLISSMLMRSVTLKKPGIYTFELELRQDKSDKVVDKKSCSLVVAEHREKSQ